MNDLRATQQAVEKAFTEAFGRTPLKERLSDILTQAMDLSRYPDVQRLREEAGDLLCSLLQLFNECGWDPLRQADETLKKIDRRMQQYKTLPRRLHVALLGGAFNPVTNGHVGVAQFVLNTSKVFDEVWLMPCNEHMNGKDMQSAERRLEMCRLAARRDGRIKVFDYEVRHRLKGESYTVAKRLRDDPEYADQYAFSLIIGQDNANTLTTWVNGEDLERMIRFVVVPRRGIDFDPASTWYLKPPHVYLAANDTIMHTSSTAVRQMLKDNDPRLADHVDPKVLEYIRANKLYA